MPCPRYACSLLKACHVLYLVEIEQTTLTHAAIVLGLNVGTVCHIVHRRRFLGAVPIPPE
jgi:hypothetical protein